MKKNLKLHIGGKEKLFFKKTHFMALFFSFCLERKKM